MSGNKSKNSSKTQDTGAGGAPLTADDTEAPAGAAQPGGEAGKGSQTGAARGSGGSSTKRAGSTRSVKADAAPSPEAEGAAVSSEDSQTEIIRAAVDELKQSVEYKEWSQLEQRLQGAVIWGRDRFITASELVSALEGVLRDAADVELTFPRIVKASSQGTNVDLALETHLLWSGPEVWREREIHATLHLGYSLADGAAAQLRTLGLTDLGGRQVAQPEADTSQGFGAAEAYFSGVAQAAAPSLAADGAYFASADHGTAALGAAESAYFAPQAFSAAPEPAYFSAQASDAAYFSGGPSLLAQAPSSERAYFAPSPLQAPSALFAAPPTPPAAPAPAAGGGRMVMVFAPMFVPAEVVKALLGTSGDS